MEEPEILSHGINITSLAIMGVIGLACYILKKHGTYLEEFEKRISDNEVEIARLQDRTNAFHQTLEKIDKKLDVIQQQIIEVANRRG